MGGDRHVYYATKTVPFYRSVSALLYLPLLSTEVILIAVEKTFGFCDLFLYFKGLGDYPK